MSRPRMAPRVGETVRACLSEGIARGVFPGAVVVVVHRGATLVRHAQGHAQVVPRRIPMRLDTVFDLASVTKPVATTTAVLRLWARGAIELDAPISTYLPRFAQAGKARVTARHLLAHTSGLPAWEMLYLPGPLRAHGAARLSGPRRAVGTARLREPRGAAGTARAPACRSIREAVDRICATPLAAPPGTRVEYSDLGFIVLGHLVERLSGESLGGFLRRHVFAPLGMSRTRFRPPVSWRSWCAATEVGNVYERSRAAEQGLGRGFRWRTGVIRGQVHDGNAWHLGRGVAGHAGLFGSADDVARFGRAMLSGGRLGAARVLPEQVVAESLRSQTRGLGPEPRGLGWALQGTPFLGAKASPAAFGHTGFTGTSLLVDPARRLVVVLLTNRVHPRADSTAIQQFRPAFHDAVIEALDG
jgi:CubicO group peptidase (beta-lactamase class C family)